MSRAARRPEQVALFDDEIPEAPPAPRVNDRLEAAALAEVLKTLKHHPLVAWAERQNSGVARMGGRFVRFGWPGCSDVIGQLKDGRLLAVEVKAPKGKATEEQSQFLDMVRRFDGVAFLARDCRDVLRELAADEVLT
ncbi:MAG: VRR-NUC domain-containing protein [Candidatus Accumulibacter sp. UW20]